MNEDRQEEEVDKNFKVFKEKYLPELLEKHRGKLALMRNEKIVGLYNTRQEAFASGLEKFKEDKIFSIQEVTDKPIDLRAFPYALPIQKT